MSKPKILLIDDSKSFLDLFTSLSGAEDFDIMPIGSAEKALDYLEKEPVELVISDVMMTGMSGVELFKVVKERYPELPFIMVTAHGSTEKAIQALKMGAFHYFEKPVHDKLDLFWTTVREAISKHRMFKENLSLKKEKVLGMKMHAPIIGRSNGIKHVFQSIKDIAELPVTVLVQGETGTGKELVARAIHNQSDRKANPFFAVNCNEFAPGILESELFGHEKGAFTGASSQKKGLFEIADKGTLLLDEISEAPMPLQSKLLRVLETQHFTRVGGTSITFSDFRIIAATNANLEAEIAAGRFRKDLYYRLNVYTINIPPLRERKDDIHLIAEYYVKLFSRKYRKPAGNISESAIMVLRSYDWPGNVRELVNVIERAVITCRHSDITPEDLPFHSQKPHDISDLNLKDMEKLYIELALKRTHNNKTQAAKLLEIGRKTLSQKLKTYGVEDDETS